MRELRFLEVQVEAIVRTAVLRSIPVKKLHRFRL